MTEKGVMPHNEDAILIGRRVFDSGETEQLLEQPFITAVSDGVSGENSGELASRMCLERIKNISALNLEQIKNSISSIHSELAEIGLSSKTNHNMQATLCGIAVLNEKEIIAFNVGDSRLYRFRQGMLRQLSRDQSLVQLMYENGEISEYERKNHIRKNIIFPVIGNVKSEPMIDAEYISGGAESGDLLLLCTDGLSDYVPAMDIQEILELPKSLPERIRLLINTALERKCNDNISVIAVLCQASE